MGVEHLFPSSHFPPSPVIPLCGLPHGSVLPPGNTQIPLSPSPLDILHHPSRRPSLHGQCGRTRLQHLLSQTRRCVLFPSRKGSHTTHDGRLTIAHDGGEAFKGYYRLVWVSHLGIHLRFPPCPIHLYPSSRPLTYRPYLGGRSTGTGHDSRCLLRRNGSCPCGLGQSGTQIGRWKDSRFGLLAKCPVRNFPSPRYRLFGGSWRYGKTGIRTRRQFTRFRDR